MRSFRVGLSERLRVRAGTGEREGFNRRSQRERRTSCRLSEDRAGCPAAASSLEGGRRDDVHRGALRSGASRRVRSQAGARERGTTREVEDDDVRTHRPGPQLDPCLLARQVNQIVSQLADASLYSRHRTRAGSLRPTPTGWNSTAEGRASAPSVTEQTHRRQPQRGCTTARVDCDRAL
jgi:hypothetical protein